MPVPYFFDPVRSAQNIARLAAFIGIPMIVVINGC